MRNITGMIGRYLSGVSLPSMNIIDIIEIMLIAFFVYQFMVWIKFTRAYTLLKGLLVPVSLSLVELPPGTAVQRNSRHVHSVSCHHALARH